MMQINGALTTQHIIFMYLAQVALLYIMNGGFVR